MRPGVLLLAGGAVLAAYLYSKVASGSGTTFQNVGENIGSAAIDLVSGVVTGAYDAMPEPVKQEVTQVKEGQTWLNPFYAAGQIQNWLWE